MTMREVVVGQTVLIRAPVLAAYQNCCQIGLPADFQGGLRLVTVPYEIVFARDTEALVAASMELLRKIERVVDIGAKVAAEVHELGGFPLPKEACLWLRPRETA